MPNYYQLLHVQTDAPTPVIKASYRAMMQKMRLHPDLGGDEAIAKQLNEAVATLCDPKLRAQYDLRRLNAEQQRSPDPGGTPTPEPSPEPRTDQHKTQQADSPHTRDAGKSSTTDAPDASTDTAPDSATTHLPAKSKCPFCEAIYPWTDGKKTNSHGARGYENSNSHCSRCHGATTSINALPESSASDLRKIYRHELQNDVNLWAQWPVDTPVKGKMTDLSTAGCALLCELKLPVQNIILLDSPLLNSICQVRYCKQLGSDTHYAIGLEFLTLHIIAEPGAVFSATV